MSRRNFIEPLCWAILFGVFVGAASLYAGYLYGLSTPAPTPAPSAAPTAAPNITSRCADSVCTRTSALLQRSVACPLENAQLPYTTPCIYRDLYPQCVVGVCSFAAGSGTCVLPERSDYDEAALLATTLEEFECDCVCDPV